MKIKNRNHSKKFKNKNKMYIKSKKIFYNQILKINNRKFKFLFEFKFHECFKRMEESDC